MKEELEQRISGIQRGLKHLKLQAMIVESRDNSFYLSGFPCTASLVLITLRKAFFFTDFRYLELARSKIEHMQVESATQKAFTQVAELVKKLGIRRLGFEGSAPYSQVEAMKSVFDSTELSDSESIIRDLRMIKSETELQTIGRNQRLNQKIFKSTLTSVQPGMRETDVKKIILQKMIVSNCEEAFATILAAGANSANPHAVPGNRRVHNGELLLFDMGVKQNYYHSDMTRTVAVGEKLDSRCVDIYDIVRQAQAAALRELGPGVPCKQVDAVARNIITSAGYGDKFGHGLGHGVGLEIHEAPTLNPRSADVLKPGMTVTVEPGIYLPGIGGVRIEDLVVITDNGYKNLTSIGKQLVHI